MPAMWPFRWLAGEPWSDRLYGLPSSSFGVGWNNFSGHTQAAANVVSGDLACDQPKKWRQRHQRAGAIGAGKLSDGLDLVAQAASSHGAARPRSIARARRGGRRVGRA